MLKFISTSGHSPRCPTPSPTADHDEAEAAGVAPGGRGTVPRAQQRARAVPHGRAPRRVRARRGPRARGRGGARRRGPRRGRRCARHRVAPCRGAAGRGRGRRPRRPRAVQGQLRRVRAGAQADAQARVHPGGRRAMERGPARGGRGGRGGRGTSPSRRWRRRRLVVVRVRGPRRRGEGGTRGCDARARASGAIHHRSEDHRCARTPS